jgi:nucleotide-binding universal stress UspA family protein
MDDRPILIAYDGSQGARRAIRAAAELLGPRRAVVLDIASPVTTAESIALTSSIVPGNGFEDLNIADALVVAREGVEYARAAGFEAEPRAALSAPTWDGVVETADELDAAVIVLGSRGLKGLREQLEGSISHEVAEHAGRPVLIIPPAPSTAS